MLEQTWETRVPVSIRHENCSSLGDHEFSTITCVIEHFQVRGPFLKSSAIPLSQIYRVPKLCMFLVCSCNQRVCAAAAWAAHLQTTEWNPFCLAKRRARGHEQISGPWGLRFVIWATRWSRIWKRSPHQSQQARLHTRALLPGLHQASASLTPALFPFIISGVQIKPQEERETSLPVGKLIRIWEIMLQITAFFGDVPHNLRQNTLDSIQSLHHRDYGKLRWLQMVSLLNRGVSRDSRLPDSHWTQTSVEFQINTYMRWPRPSPFPSIIAYWTVSTQDTPHLEEQLHPRCRCESEMWQVSIALPAPGHAVST